MTRNLATQIIDDAIDGIGQLVCAGLGASEAKEQITKLQDKLKADPQLVSAKTLFNTYVTGFGAAIIAYQIVFIQIFSCCSIYVRNKCSHICSTWWAFIGFIVFLAAGLAITLIYILLESGTSGLPGGPPAPPAPAPGVQPAISAETGLNCAFYEKNPYKINSAMCTDSTLFAPDKYFASSICGRTSQVLRAWAAMMFLLALTGMFATFSGCCLNGCCSVAPSFEDPEAAQGKEMTAVATSQAAYVHQAAPYNPHAAPGYAQAAPAMQYQGGPMANPNIRHA